MLWLTIPLSIGSSLRLKMLIKIRNYKRSRSSMKRWHRPVSGNIAKHRGRGRKLFLRNSSKSKSLKLRLRGYGREICCTQLFRGLREAALTLIRLRMESHRWLSPIKILKPLNWLNSSLRTSWGTLNSQASRSWSSRKNLRTWNWSQDGYLTPLWRRISASLLSTLTETGMLILLVEVFAMETIWRLTISTLIQAVTSLRIHRFMGGPCLEERSRWGDLALRAPPKRCQWLQLESQFLQELLLEDHRQLRWRKLHRRREDW